MFKLHPLERTAQDLRRSQVRLENMLEAPIEIKPDEFKAATDILKLLRQAHNLVPERYRDTDKEKRKG